MKKLEDLICDIFIPLFLIELFVIFQILLIGALLGW